MTESSLKNDDDKVIKGFRNEKSPAQLWAERKAKQNSGNAETKAEAPKPEVPEDEPEGEPDVKDLKSKFEGLAASEKRRKKWKTNLLLLQRNQNQLLSHQTLLQATRTCES